MNRKLYEENQQYKDRNIEQRQQIEHYHVLFQENQQKNEITLNALRKERDEAFQRENELKRRMQQQLDSKQQENFMLISNLKDKYESLKSNETQLADELETIKLALQQERASVEQLEKKCKQLEKDNSVLKESFSSDKQQYETKISDLEQRNDKLKRDHEAELKKLLEKSFVERDDLKTQMGDLERKFEEVIKEKAQLACKYGQLADENRELNSMIQTKEAYGEQKVEELK